MSIDWPTTFLGKLEKRYEDQNNPCGTAVGIGGSVCVNRLCPVEAGGGGMKDEALKLALKALRFARDDGYENEVSQQAITAIKQALALDKKAENARELGLDYEPVGWWDAKIGFFEEKHFDQLQPLYTTPPAQPAVPDAIIEAGESPEFRDGWNECRETILQMLKARKA
jgi:hypothetical protein